MFPFRTRRLILIGAVGLVLCVDAAAHALLVKSDPARRATLRHPPREVRLWFSERLEPAYAKLTVLDAADKPVTDADAVVSENDGKLLTLRLPSLAAGTYTVKYKVLSVDGHANASQFSFTIKNDSGAR